MVVKTSVLHFNQTRECLISNLQECFIEDDVHSTTNETLVVLMKTITKVWLSPFYQKVDVFNKSESEINSFLSDCPNIPNENSSKKGISNCLPLELVCEWIMIAIKMKLPKLMLEYQNV